VVGAKIFPALISSSVSVTLDAPNTTLTPRTNEIDFGLQKRLKFGRLHVDPRADIFNALNSSAFYTVRATAFSPILNTSVANPTLSPALPSLAAGTSYTNYRAPTRFLDGRVLRLGFNITW
jgi:hypothetical protein